MRGSDGAGLRDLLPEGGGDDDGSFGSTRERDGVWNIVQALGNKESQRVERYAELAEQGAGNGTIAAPILYEENDGVRLKLQGKDRKEYGSDKEMKVGIAYDGVTWDAAKTRKELHNKVAYATCDDAKAFKNRKEGVIAHCFDLKTVKLRVMQRRRRAMDSKKQSETLPERIGRVPFKSCLWKIQGFSTLSPPSLSGRASPTLCQETLYTYLFPNRA